MSGRYEASVINAYFDILVRYGDQNVTLNCDLIEVNSQRRHGGCAPAQPGVRPDRAVKKVVYGFQAWTACCAVKSRSS
ncbi:hypothetical protein [Candidatus Amarolinea dominans]|uniref:hypothetical protein n=1 Tax=Candidatus Amarolinea dominans TaxID=3140696 RepID=UPI001D4F928B|nr:hypothetical protein [Anaerolineae bacterium]